MCGTIQLTELQRDAITELLNIGMGQAADSLSQIVKDEVHLSIPDLQLLSRQGAISLLEEKAEEDVVAVKQHFYGTFWGNALLLFLHNRELELLRAMMGNHLTEEELLSLKQDALSEIGNIILGSCLSSLTNILNNGTEVTSDLPIFLLGSATEVLDESVPDIDDAVMFLRMDFQVHSKDIEGYVALILDVNSVSPFIRSIDRYLGFM